jgi:hypothetical protein
MREVSIIRAVRCDDHRSLIGRLSRQEGGGAADEQVRTLDVLQLRREHHIGITTRTGGSAILSHRRHGQPMNGWCL